jgi:hypothetical protein
MRALRSLVFAALLAWGLAAIPTATVSAQELVGEGQKSGTKVVIRDLKRDDGGTLTLRFRMISERDKPEGIYQLLGGYLNDRVHLLDAANKKKYLVVKDSAGKCECTQIRGNVSKNEPVNLWAKFPAPPESVQKVTVVVDGFEPIESVPVKAR